MDTCGLEVTCNGVNRSGDGVGRKNMSAVGVGVAEEVCEGDGREGVVVCEVGFVEFYHCGNGGRLYILWC